MPIKLLLADTSDVMRAAIRKLLKEELGIEVIGTAVSLTETLQLAAALKPDVVLMDPHMQDEHEYSPELIKSQILLHTKCILAISTQTDDEAKALADRFGARVLLDKMNLFSELIPAIMQHCPNVSISTIAEPLGEKLKQSCLP